MKNILLIIFAIILSSPRCVREGDDCHRVITIINQSSDSIIRADNGHNTKGECFLTGSPIPPQGNYVYTKRSCFEDVLSAGETFEFYIIDPNHYNEPGIFYDCDLIEIKNTILKHYVLTLEDLKSSNFTVIYP